MTSTRTAGQIRPLLEEDISQVACLQMKVHGGWEEESPESLSSRQKHLRQVFLENPWRDEAGGSLVYQEDDGRISGFIGVVPRRMSFDGKALRAAILSEFVVDSSARGFTGLQLLRTALAGPQDFSFSDQANEASRTMLERFGGITSILYSTRWTYPVRPFQFARYSLKTRQVMRPLLLSLSAPGARTLDALVKRVFKFPPAPSAPVFSEEEPTCEKLLECLAGVAEKRRLRAEYDYNSLSWVLDRAGRKKKRGRLQRVLVRTETQEIGGWYLYYANPGRVSEVVQFYAKPRWTHGVMEHLFQHAWQRGAIAVSGRLEPDLTQVVSEKQCLCNLGPDWVTLHSRHPELLRAFERGEARLSRLDGELCLHRR